MAITGLDENGNRLKSGSIYLSHLAWSDLQKFSIKIPRTGGEKTFLFHYWYDDHLNASSGPLNLELWFEDSPDPAYVPEMLITPPGY
ncbi:MAG: hypothetical protein HZA01_12830 [Nitrospinae bacterium]|nr:hypothetical protein [Nitrospinota bacterium]